MNPLSFGRRINIVTGGGGFIGLNLVEDLLQRGDQVAIFDNHTTGYNAKGVRQVTEKFGILSNFTVDVSDYKSLEEAVKLFLGTEQKVYIYHLAASSHVDRSITDPVSFVHNNVIGTANLLEIKRKFPKDIELLVVSTDEVYGDEGPFPTPLNAPLSTSSPYSASKAAADLLVQAYNRTYGLNIKISRCCNNFGKFQHGEKFIPTILRKIASGESIPVYGNGLQLRQWVPAREHAKRLVHFMHSDSGHHQHVGGYCTDNLSLIKIVADLLNVEAKIEFVADRPGHDVRYELLDEKSIGREEFISALQSYVQIEKEFTHVE